MDDISAENVSGRYHLLSLLGRGGMGEVWLAEDPILRRLVAIKRLAPHHSADQEYRQRFEREARAAAALHHPHILPVHDYGQQLLPDGRVGAYIVMSYVANGSLEDRLVSVEHQGRLLPSEEAFSYLTQAAQAIDYAHEQGVLHRDIKPGNMLLREDGTLLLADFGLARLTAETDGDHNLTQTGMPIGTPRYMAPEQGQGKAVKASDIYSLAIIAYRCFTGRYPFEADTPYAMMIQQVIAQPRSPRQFNSALSPASEETLLHALAKDPAQRPATAQDFIQQLRKSQPRAQGQTTQAPAPTSTHELPEAPAPPPTAQSHTLPRRTFLLAGGAVLGGASIIAVAFSPLGHTLFTPKATTRSDSGPTPAATQNQNSPSPIQIQSVLNKPVIQLAWSPLKTTLAACGQDGQCVLWDFLDDQKAVPSTQARRSLNSDSLAPLSIAWSPDGTMLAVSNADALNPGAVLVYKSDLSNLAPGFSASTIKSSQQNRGVLWAPERFLLVFNSVNNSLYQSSLRIYDPGQPEQKATPALINGGPANFTTETLPTALSPDGATLALSIGTMDLTHGVLTGKVSLTATQVQWHPVPLMKTRYEVTNIAWSPGGRYLAAAAPGDIDQILYIWDASQGYQPLKPGLDLTTIPEQLRCVAWSPTKQFLLAAGGSAGKVYLWNVQASGPSLARILPGITGKVTALAWSHDGRWLAASYDDNLDSILVWRLE